MSRILIISLSLSILLLTACSSIPTTPRNTENLCAIFKQKKGWYEASNEAFQKWGISVPIQMAIIYQESHFVADAEPSGRFLLGVIPWFSGSSAYGYPQAQDATWSDYQKKTGNWLASRDNFADACDFIGWYLQTNSKKLGIGKTDTRNLYLSYHEGLGGFQRQTYNQKPWLLTISNKVAQRAQLFSQQLNSCN